MKTLFALIPILLITGCVGVPIDRKFPDLPESLKQPCSNLQIVPEDNTKLSEIISTVTINYRLYHECQIKVESWQEWYSTQKKIFEGAN